MSFSDFVEVSGSVEGHRFSFSPAHARFSLPDGSELGLSLRGWMLLRRALSVLTDDTEAAPTGASGPASLVSGPPNRGRAWTAEEEARCMAAFGAGDDPADIALALGRSRGAVMARLVRLGCLDEAEVELRFPPGRPAAARITGEG